MMVKSSSLYLLIDVAFASMYASVFVDPHTNLVAIFGFIGVLLFWWRIIRGDD
jgi:hypothetical protein